MTKGNQRMDCKDRLETLQASLRAFAWREVRNMENNISKLNKYIGGTALVVIPPPLQFCFLLKSCLFVLLIWYIVEKVMFTFTLYPKQVVHKGVKCDVGPYKAYLKMNPSSFLSQRGRHLFFKIKTTRKIII